MTQLTVVLGSIIPDSVNLQFRQEGCILQATIDGGTTWTTIADFTSCAAVITSVTTTTLSPGSDATATLTSGVLALGIPGTVPPQFRVQ